MAKARARGQGEGSIHKRKDGRWAAVVDLGYRNGKRWRKTFYGRTHGAVSAKLKEALRNQQLGINVAPERLTVGQFLDRWLEDCVKPSTRPRTHRSYSDAVEIHIKPHLGKVVLSKMDAMHVQRFVNDKLKEKLQDRKSKKAKAAEIPDAEKEKKDENPRTLSPRTVQYLQSVLSRALNRAVKWDLVVRNVAKLATPPRVKRPDIKPLSPDEARTLLKAIRNNRNEALYTVAMALGVRKGEALGLRWPDIDLEAGTLRVRYALQRVGRKLQLVEPKSERSRRAIALPEMAVKALRTHRARQAKERLLAGSRWQEGGYVFTTGIGTPMDERRVSKHFKKTLTAAELPTHRFHDLRHTAATLLLVQGVHPRAVMDILGHSQISLTLNTYSHVLPAVRRDAADRMEQILAQGE